MGIPGTGRMDKLTRKRVYQKRCGMPDKTPRNQDLKIILTESGKRKRRSLISSSKKTQYVFYWQINPAPSDVKGVRFNFAPHIYLAMEYAFNRWASVCNVVFIRGDGLGYSDILVGFWKGKFFKLFHIMALID